jgi:hypothetical protein
MLRQHPKRTALSVWLPPLAYHSLWQQQLWCSLCTSFSASLQLLYKSTVAAVACLVVVIVLFKFV